MMMNIDGSGRARGKMYRDEIFAPVETGGSTNKGDIPYPTDISYILTRSYLFGVCSNSHGWMIVDW